RGLEARDAREPWLPPRVRGVHVAVEHQARPAAGALADAEHVGAPTLDLLPLHAQAEVEERLTHQLGHRLLVARKAGRADGAARPPHPATAGHCGGHAHPPRRSRSIAMLTLTRARAGEHARRTAGSVRAGCRPRARA